MSRQLVTLAVLALSFIACCSATRSNGLIETIDNQLNRFLKDETNRKRADEPFTMLFKYLVRPSSHDDFIDEWMKLRDETKEEKGCRKIILNKPLTDNTHFHAVAAWDSKDDFIKHFESDYVQDYMKFLAKEDIPFFMTSLIRVEDEDWYKKGFMKSMSTGPFGSDLDFLEKGAVPFLDLLKQPPIKFDVPKRFHLVCRYIVPPSECKDFTSEWLKTRDPTEEEKGNNEYCLGKTMSDNIIFYSYAEWERPDDFYEHVQSKHVQDFVSYLKDRDVPVHSSIVLPVEERDRKKP
jgi:quinol monooxygenase YgiN